MKEPQVTITINLSYSQLPDILSRLTTEEKDEVLELKTEEAPPSVDQEKPKKEVVKRAALVSKEAQKCIICGNEFYPKSNAQKKCPDCKGVKVNKHEQLDKTLDEIEKNRKEPYQFSN